MILFCLFQAKNIIEYKSGSNKSIKIDPKAVADLKDKNWFQGRQGGMFIKSHNSLNEPNTTPNKKVSDGYKDILPLNSDEFFHYLGELENVG